MLKEERGLFFGVAYHQQTAAPVQCLPDKGRNVFQSGSTRVLNFRAFENIPKCFLLRNQVDWLPAQRMPGGFQVGLCGGAEHDGGIADLRQEIDGQVEKRQHFAGNGLHLVNDENAVAQRVKSADGAGFPAEAGVEQLHKRGDDDGRRPRIREKRQRLQSLWGILRLHKVGVVLQNQGIIPHEPPDHLGILIQNGQ